MEIYEILDRYELLYPEIESFKDLRRLYVDRDWSSLFKLCDQEELRKAIIEKNAHSIFRLISNKEITGDIEDLRKATLEMNLHSLFRLLPDNEDLRKAVTEDNEHSIFRISEMYEEKKIVLDDNYWSLFKWLYDQKDTSITDGLKSCYREKIKFDHDCLSQGQIKSKKWLIEVLEDAGVNIGITFLCAGWYGLLGSMILESKIRCTNITSFDLDPSTENIANIFNKRHILDEWRFKHVCQDIFDIKFGGHIFDVTRSDGSTEKIWETPDTVINTSCEHIRYFDNWYSKMPIGTLCIFQTNDYYQIEEHINCSKTLEEFASQTPMRKVVYEGERDLGKYKRFMRIGYK